MKAVTFDFWNTLVRADEGGVQDRRLEAWLGLLAGEGIEIDHDSIDAAMRHASERFSENWMANRFYGADAAVADMLAHLDIDGSPQFRAGLVHSITDPDPAHDPSLTPSIGDTLEGLRSRGIRIGIICDVGLAPSTTLRRYLASHGVLEFFDHWSFSDEVGTFKPDPVIFDHALAGLGGVDPAAAAHVGDLRRTDVAGAKAKGITAVRYAGVYDDPGSAADGSDTVEADAVIADHAELLAALGLD